MTEEHKKSISKFLSLVLRHQPQEIGLVLNENGWADVAEISQKRQAFFDGRIRRNCNNQ